MPDIKTTSTAISYSKEAMKAAKRSTGKVFSGHNERQPIENVPP